MKIRIFPSMNEMSDFIAEEIIRGISAKEKDEDFTLSLSGGNTPKAIFQYISTHFADKTEWNKVKIFWGDERCVPPEDPESNFGMARKFLLDHLPIPQQNIFRICGECEPEQAAERYEKTIRDQVAFNGTGPVFDLFLLGLGPEGHTASIFPDRLSLFESEKWFDVARHPQTGQVRITATGKVINNARDIFFLVSGDEKKEIVKKIVKKEPGWKNLPASHVQALHGSVYWLTDEAAAQNISI
ncbi:MAG: 6-phosphogluconolactonase [Bacteroidales bacterium]|nr:6-phosphogluconolactonase [Bacteroidales bacterium]